MNLALRSLEATQFQVHDLVSLVKDQSKQLERLMTKDKEKSQQIAILMAKDEEKSQQIERLMTKDKEKSQEIERLMSHVKNQSQQKERLMTTVQDQSQQIEMLKIMINTHASFAWKIPNIQAILDRSRDVRLQNEDIILSQPFYLSENGYRLRIILKSSVPSSFLKEPHFVFYVRAVAGEFDHLLSWPLNAKIRLTLIDQNPCKDKREDKLCVADLKHGRILCGGRPYQNDAFDFGVLTVTQEHLRTGTYIMNDAIFIMANKA